MKRIIKASEETNPSSHHSKHELTLHHLKLDVIGTGKDTDYDSATIYDLLYNRYVGEDGYPLGPEQFDATFNEAMDYVHKWRKQNREKVD